ncbi:NAD(P)H-dependent oxidoreductase [Streptomyces sp. NPDC057199]|uniref:NAD(P)H-dependent oxidoreductase n=1 Tax=Streptomyces sp. NPDC057199 TaxID=3346047 RepID=UPI00364327BE
MPHVTDPATRNALVVFGHHRVDSLTAHTAREAAAQLESAGYRVDLCDLHGEGFDPRMRVEDQPDWGDREKAYSAEVESHQQRILAADLVVVVFPVYWTSLSALVKGWVDRVWNYGFAYGRSKPRLKGKSVLWLGLSGGASDDPMLEKVVGGILEESVSKGIGYYCGFSYSVAKLLPDAEEYRQRAAADSDKLKVDIEDAVVGERRTAQYEAFHARARQHVAEFLEATVSVAE